MFKFHTGMKHNEFGIDYPSNLTLYNIDLLVPEEKINTVKGTTVIVIVW
jgi:hypothetical protein